MVSKASDDLPEPLTPVTTVTALCGISTVTFLRLWTRAPRTRRRSCSGFEVSADAVIGLVAKAKPRQRVSKPLPKLQIIRRLSNAGKSHAVSADIMQHCAPRCEVTVPD